MLTAAAAAAEAAGLILVISLATPPKRALSYFGREWPTITVSGVLTAAAAAAEAAGLILVISLAQALSTNQQRPSSRPWGPPPSN